MYRSGLVPRWMPLLGLIGGPLLLVRFGELFEWWVRQARSACRSPRVRLGAVAGNLRGRLGVPTHCTHPRGARAMTPRLERLLALSGVAFAVLLVVGFLISGGNTPDYAADDQEWLRWADGNEIKSRIGAFLVLLAGLAGLHFMATVRSMWGRVETTVRAMNNSRGSRRWGWSHTGITLPSSCSRCEAEGADADPTVIETVASATLVGPFLSPHGFCCVLAAVVFHAAQRDLSAMVGIVAILGAGAF